MVLRRSFFFSFFLFCFLPSLFPSGFLLERTWRSLELTTFVNLPLELKFSEVDTKNSDKDIIADLFTLNSDLLIENDRNLLIMQNYEISIKELSQQLSFFRFAFVVLSFVSSVASTIYIIANVE